VGVLGVGGLGGGRACCRVRLGGQVFCWVVSRSGAWAPTTQAAIPAFRATPGLSNAADDRVCCPSSRHPTNSARRTGPT
jgi:hypothetical protein